MYLQKIGAYWSTRAEGYSIKVNEELSGHEQESFAEILRTYAPEGTKLSCLDVGCGPGFFSILLSRMGHRVSAIDYSDGMLEKARENFRAAGVTVSLRQGDAQSLPFPDESFDYVVSRNLVWDLEDPEGAYREWIRVLKPGGRILVVDGNHYLYYYDADYRAMRPANDRLIYGVDPTPINEIARDLPMSKVLRPHWDLEKLLDLGMTALRADVQHLDTEDPDTGKKHRIITEFCVSAGKPLKSQEA